MGKKKKTTEEKIPKLTKRMTMHLNGGSDYSVINYDVYADGKLTPIKNTVRTDGRPNYKTTVNVWTCGDEEYDLLKGNNHDLCEWLLKQLRTVAKE